MVTSIIMNEDLIRPANGLRSWYSLTANPIPVDGARLHPLARLMSQGSLRKAAAWQLCTGFQCLSKVWATADLSQSKYLLIVLDSYWYWWSSWTYIEQIHNNHNKTTSSTNITHKASETSGHSVNRAETLSAPHDVSEARSLADGISDLGPLMGRREVPSGLMHGNPLEMEVSYGDFIYKKSQLSSKPCLIGFTIRKTTEIDGYPWVWPSKRT